MTSTFEPASFRTIELERDVRGAAAFSTTRQIMPLYRSVDKWRPATAGYALRMAGVEQVRTAPPRWREIFAGARGRQTAGLLILEALVAIEIMVVATILPAVQRDLEGLQLYGWNYAALTLASFGTVPIAGRITDRIGPRPVFGVTIAFYMVGLVLAATAPTMLVLVFARFVQGIGGGGLYVVSLATVAKTYPERIRPRVMALLASMWILPGLLGPPIGALIAETVGWRWAFLAPMPAIVLAGILVMPSLRGVTVSEDESRLPVVASLVLMVGVGLLLAGLTSLSILTVPLVLVGLVVAVPSLRKVTPPGTLRARPGIPAAAAAAFLASAAFFSVDGFVTLMLTETSGTLCRRGRDRPHVLRARVGGGIVVAVPRGRARGCSADHDAGRRVDRDRGDRGRRSVCSMYPWPFRTRAGRSAASGWASCSRRSRSRSWARRPRDGRPASCPRRSSWTTSGSASGRGSAG